MRFLPRALFQGRQVGIKKSKGVWWLDHSDSSSALSFHYLFAQGLHSRPVHFWPEMMLGMEAVKKPDPIEKLVVTTHPPGKRLVRVAAVMAVIAVEIGKAMAKIPERHKKTDVAPVENAENDKGKNEQS